MEIIERNHIEILKLKSTKSKMKKKITESLNGILDIVEERVNKLEDRSTEINQTEAQRKKD